MAEVSLSPSGGGARSQGAVGHLPPFFFFLSSFQVKNCRSSPGCERCPRGSRPAQEKPKPGFIAWHLPQDPVPGRGTPFFALSFGMWFGQGARQRRGGSGAQSAWLREVVLLKLFGFLLFYFPNKFSFKVVYLRLKGTRALLGCGTRAPCGRPRPRARLQVWDNEPDGLKSSW